MTSCLYVGHVRHRRRRPRVHAFRYRVFQFYLDLDELPEVDRRVRLFSVNRFNAAAYHDRDHLDGRGGDVRAGVARVLREAGVSLAAPRVRLLTQCRILGRVFNPISLYYCHEGPDGPLRAVLAEVDNTFGERHVYVLRRRLDAPGRPAPRTARYRAAKALHVSPFLAMEGHYDFHLGPAGAMLHVGIRQHERGRPTLDTHFRGRRVPLTTRALAAVLAAHPLAAVHTLAAIHGEALRLWWKGLPVHRWTPRPGGPALATSTDDPAPRPAVAAAARAMEEEHDAY